MDLFAAELDRLADFSDNRRYWGHAFSLVCRAESLLMDHVLIAGRVIQGKMVREDQPLYPPRATREALANAQELEWGYNPIDPASYGALRTSTRPGGAILVVLVLAGGLAWLRRCSLACRRIIRA